MQRTPGLWYDPNMRTDFYLLPTENLAERDSFVCRLIEKAFLSGKTLYVATDSAEEATKLDQLLWEFRADSFIPHQLSDSPSESPIIIGTLSTMQSADILLNLSQQNPPEQLPYQRLIEVIPKDPAWQDKARERFRQYRKLGYNLHTHQLS